MKNRVVIVDSTSRYYSSIAQALKTDISNAIHHRLIMPSMAPELDTDVDGNIVLVFETGEPRNTLMFSGLYLDPDTFDVYINNPEQAFGIKINNLAHMYRTFNLPMTDPPLDGPVRFKLTGDVESLIGNGDSAKFRSYLDFFLNSAPKVSSDRKDAIKAFTAMFAYAYYLKRDIASDILIVSKNPAARNLAVSTNGSFYAGRWSAGMFSDDTVMRKLTFSHFRKGDISKSIDMYEVQSRQIETFYATLDPDNLDGVTKKLTELDVYWRMPAEMRARVTLPDWTNPKPHERLTPLGAIGESRLAQRNLKLWFQVHEKVYNKVVAL